MRKSDKLLLLSTIFVSVMIVSNFLGNKMLSIGPVVLSVATPMMLITSMCTDVISDVWGVKTTRLITNFGFLANVIALVLTRLAIVAPFPEFWTDQAQFEVIFGSQWRLVLASLTAYLASQHTDIFVFFKIKEKTGEKALWLRTRISTAVSQAVDTVLFSTLAFWGTVPAGEWIALLAGQYVVRVLISVLDTPLCYLGVAWARKESQNV